MERKKVSTGKQIKRFLCYLPLFVMFVFFAVIILMPLVWMFLGAFKSDAEMLVFPPKYFPVANHLVENWESVCARIDIMAYVKNTAIYAFGCTLPGIFINALAGYTFARFNFRGKNIIFVIFLATMMIPFQVIMVPLYLEVYYFGWLNTFWGLIMPKIVSAYWIFLCRAAFQNLPKDLEDAARIDGCHEMGIFVRIMLPLVTPTMITMLLLGINGCWNDLLWPLIVANSTKMRTLSNGLAVFIGDRTSEYSKAFVASAAAMLPMLLLYLFGQKYFVQGQATSGLKS